MGLRGAKKKPDWLAVLDGNPGKRAVGRGLKAPTTNAIEPPEHFDDGQRRLWANVCDVLAKVNALSIADQFALVRYVELLHEYRKAADWMAKQSDGNVVYPIRDKGGIVKSIRMLPQLKAMLEISNHLLRIEQHFGLTPSSRASIMRPDGSSDIGDIDPFA